MVHPKHLLMVFI